MNYLVVEDQPNHAELLIMLMLKNFPHFQHLATANTLDQAKDFIQKKRPDFIFLDVNLGNENGFDLLEEISHVQTGVIVVTAEPNYIHDALKARAHEFLVKPVSSTNLKAAVEHTLHILHRENSIPTVATQASEIYSKVSMPTVVKNKIILPETTKSWLVEIEEIIFVKAAGNQSEIYLTNKEKMKLNLTAQSFIISSTLKRFEELLPAHSFLRIHDSYLINLNKVVAIGRSYSSVVMLEYNANISVTKNKEQFVQAIKHSGVSLK